LETIRISKTSGSYYLMCHARSYRFIIETIVACGGKVLAGST